MDESAFNKCHVILAESLNVQCIFPHLCENDLLTQDEKEMLNDCYLTTRQKVNKLMEILPRKGNGWLDKFILCLESTRQGTDHSNIVQKLRHERKQLEREKAVSKTNPDHHTINEDNSSEQQPTRAEQARSLRTETQSLNEENSREHEIKPMVTSKEEFLRYNNDVGNAFIKLQTEMKELLRKADCGDLRRACIAQMNNPDGAGLSPDLIDKIKGAKTIDDLFDLLVSSPCWSWIDIRILEAMVVASGTSYAKELLHNYKAVVFSKRLFDLLPSVPKKEVKEKYYAKVITKIGKEHTEITVADLWEFHSQLEGVIMTIRKGICILEDLEEGCIEAHWYIPASYVDRAYQNARANRYWFNVLHLEYLKIGHYPVIHVPLDQMDVTIPAPSPLPNVATVKDFVDHYYHYLLANMDGHAVAQLMISQQLLNETNFSSALNNYQINHLILQQVSQMNLKTLEFFSKLLKNDDNQNHIGKVLSKGIHFLELYMPTAIIGGNIDHAEYAYIIKTTRDKSIEQYCPYYMYR